MNAPQPSGEGLSAADADAVARQLGRLPRGVVRVAHRCPCGEPDVVQTRPRLPDGTPFPTLYYLTCPKAAAAVGTMESSGLMRDMERRLAEDPDLALAYRAAHLSYVSERDDIEAVPEIEGVSAGGMPARVKCLHVLVAHALARGPGINPLGDEAVSALGEWWSRNSCRQEADASVGDGE